MFAAAAAAVAAGDAEALLWSPGEKTHILPPPGGWGIRAVDWGAGADSAVRVVVDPVTGIRIHMVPEWISVEALEALEKNLLMAKRINREYSDAFVVRGDVVAIHKPYVQRT
jgi:hypothetical protein